MSNPKTIVLGNKIIELPESGIGNQGLASVLTTVSEFFSQNRYDLNEADYNTYLETVLWSDDYPHGTKKIIAKQYCHFFMANAWLFENLCNVELWLHCEDKSFTSELAPYAAKNINLGVTGLAALFHSARPRVAEEFVIGLTDEALTSTTMSALLKLAEELQIEPVVHNRITSLLGLEKDIPYSWLLQVVESLKLEEGEDD